MAENQNNGRTLPSLRGKENKLQGITTMVGFQSSDSLFFVGEGANCRESKQWLDFSYLIPSPRGRGLGRGPKQSNPPEAPYSARRAVVAWALPTKTENSIPFAIIFANVTHRQSPRYGSVQNPRCFQTTFRIKRSSETCKPALLPFWIQVKLTTRHDGKS